MYHDSNMFNFIFTFFVADIDFCLQTYCLLLFLLVFLQFVKTHTENVQILVDIYLTWNKSLLRINDYISLVLPSQCVTSLQNNGLCVDFILFWLIRFIITVTNTFGLVSIFHLNKVSSLMNIDIKTRQLSRRFVQNFVTILKITTKILWVRVSRHVHWL